MPGYTQSMSWLKDLSHTVRRLLSAYRNVFIQDDPGMHFRRVIRNAEGQRR